VLEFDGKTLVIRRDLGRAKETVEATLPVLLTVPKSANAPRWPNARLLLKYRRARSAFEVEGEAKAQGRSVDELVNGLRQRGLFIETWGAEDIGADLSRIGISGSPTKVKKVENVILTGRNLKLFKADDPGVRDLINELIDERTFG
jgi:electron transfer flavoprotein beta subunit